jgi:hypothetical protein
MESVFEPGRKVKGRLFEGDLQGVVDTRGLASLRSKVKGECFVGFTQGVAAGLREFVPSGLQKKKNWEGQLLVS